MISFQTESPRSMTALVTAGSMDETAGSRCTQGSPRKYRWKIFSAVRVASA